MATTYSDHIEFDKPVRGRLATHLHTILLIAMLTAVVTIAFLVFESRPADRQIASQGDDGAVYVVDTADMPPAVDAKFITE